MRIELSDGKYTYIFDNGKQQALRYGEPWRDLCGDKLIYSMACEIERLQAENTTIKARLEYLYGLDPQQAEELDAAIDEAMKGGE